MKFTVLLPLIAAALLQPAVAETVDSVVTNRLSEPYGVAVQNFEYFISDSANDRIVKYAPDSGILSSFAGLAGRPGTADGQGARAQFYNPRGLVSMSVTNWQELVITNRQGLAYTNPIVLIVTNTVTSVDTNVSQVVVNVRQDLSDPNRTPPVFTNAYTIVSSSRQLPWATNTAEVVFSSPAQLFSQSWQNQYASMASVLGTNQHDVIYTNWNLISYTTTTTVETVYGDESVTGTLQLVATDQAGRPYTNSLNLVIPNQAGFNYTNELVWYYTNRLHVVLTNDPGLVYTNRENLAVTSPKCLVVADYANHALRLIAADGTVFTFAGTPGQPGYDLDPVKARNAHFNFPSALAADSDGNLYIADSKNNAIRKLGLDGLIKTLNFDVVVTNFDLSTGMETVITNRLKEPSGVALSDEGEIWVSDTRNHVIKRIGRDRRNGSAQVITEIVAGSQGNSGARDSIFGTEALFNNPGSLLCLNGDGGVLVCDTGNHVIRRIYWDDDVQDYSVETYAGTLGQAGFGNGTLHQALLNAPIALVEDPLGGFLIAELGNNAVRRIQFSEAKPPIADPQIGYVTWVKDTFGDEVSKLVPVTEGYFNNDITVAVISEAGTSTHYTLGPTPHSAPEDTIPVPGRSVGSPPPQYQNGLPRGTAIESVPRDSIPDVTFKLISTQDGRRPSAIVQARFQFKVASPTIAGDNAGAFAVTDLTDGAELFYTTDGTEPKRGSKNRVKANEDISLGKITQETTFKVRGFKDGFLDSETVTKVFKPGSFKANQISFGFDNDDEGSSSFRASPGQWFYAPVTLSLLPEQSMYTLQFNVTVTNLSNVQVLTDANQISVTNITVTPAIPAGKVGFTSMLLKFIPPYTYLQIPPALFTNAYPPFDFNDPSVNNPPGVLTNLYPGAAEELGSLIITNDFNLIAVGWLERMLSTNLYSTRDQDLISYSSPHDNIFQKADMKVVVGAYAFYVPPTATNGDTYQIQIGRPSATADGISKDVYIDTPLSGNVSSRKIVTVVSTNSYLVGDVAPFRWYNAGDFGEGLLMNNDVLQTFEAAIRAPIILPPTNSDFFDAMDSSDGVNHPERLTSIYTGAGNAVIDSIKTGDGFVNVDDIFVTFQRSLDPSLKWYRRFSGSSQVVEVPNVGRDQASLPGEMITAAANPAPSPGLIPGAPSVAFSIEDVSVHPGETLDLDVRAQVVGEHPLRVAMLSVAVEPLDGAPALLAPVEFVPAESLGQPTYTSAQSIGSIGAAWLNNSAPGILGDGVLGRLKVSIPANAPATASYRVHFQHASGSPNGLGVFPSRIQDGLLAVQDVAGSSLGDGIPDSWRLRYFGSISNVLAQATADADGDGVSNWQEFKAGTNPVDFVSQFRMAAQRHANPAGELRPLLIRWPSVAQKTYTVEAAPTLVGSPWTVLASGLTGTGAEMQFAPVNTDGVAQFYRVRVSD